MADTEKRGLPDFAPWKVVVRPFAMDKELRVGYEGFLGSGSPLRVRFGRSGDTVDLDLSYEEAVRLAHLLIHHASRESNLDEIGDSK